jgi:hypothetical protein
MKIEEALYAHLTANAGVLALVSTRVYPLVIPQDIALPAIAYQRISGPRELAHDGPTGMARARIQITCQAATYTAAKAVAEAVRLALDGFRGPVAANSEVLVVEIAALANELDGYEFETAATSVRVDYMLLYVEDVSATVLGLDGATLLEVT